MHVFETARGFPRFSLGLALTAALLAACNSAAPTPPAAEGAVVAQGLNSPQGVFVASDGTLWIADSGTAGDQSFTTPPEMPGGPATTVHYGNTARVIHVDASGTATTVASLPSLGGNEEAEGVSRLAELGGHLYVTSGAWTDGADIPQLPNTAAVLRLDGTNTTEISNLWTFEAANDPDGQGKDSHPYGLAAGPDGNLWVTDAAGNDLLKVDPASGAVTLVTVFDNLPNDNPPPGVPPTSQAVPTSVAFLNDGAAYVSLLPGFPFTPGASKVVRVAGDGSKTDYATGLSMTTDLTAGPDGNLYAVQLGQFGEQGPVAKTGSIVRIKAGGVKETVLKDLDTPTSIAFNKNGDAFITVNGAAAPGSGQVLRWDNFTSRKALP